MRSLGLIGLVLALLIVGVLVKKQMNSVVPAAAPQSGAPAPTARAQSQQIQQQVREQVDAAMQARPLPDDAK
ncbi:hypothetical protein QTH89_02930 [Variovorax sp. J22G21]|uniref:hypothetical protein n=1 Tax=Variovorax fucosicus TaxID=3053517 RepID=UPI0025765544|nr:MULTISPECIES: hypothetical protein [unclassified Variovorax]MDM0041093.1 hypothetical protein [Variovorax sp. J22R193]MDM0057474.1 hypothetical protein [Variovorax sp. J22G47]MDM0060150.1 hypothetical protein [Variovorax sp. J22G21]